MTALSAVAAACAGGAAAGGTSNVATVAPFVDGEQLTYALHDSIGKVVARGVLTVRRDGERFVLSQSYEEVDVPEGLSPKSEQVTVTLDPVTLKPDAGARQRVRRDSDGVTSIEQYDWQYAPGDENDRLATRRHVDGDSDERELRLREHYYDNESSLWLWRSLNLADGYEKRYVSVNDLEGSQQTVILRVDRRETIEVPAGQFEVWRLQVRNGRATRVAWIAAEAPHVIVQWDNGSTVFRLEEISQAAE